jgi:hypothetical protein
VPIDHQPRAQRNALSSGRYSALVADGAYLQRRQRRAVIERDEQLAGFVCQRLAEGWSPQQIAGWLKSGAEPAFGVGMDPFQTSFSGPPWPINCTPFIVVGIVTSLSPLYTRWRLSLARCRKGNL